MHVPNFTRDETRSLFFQYEKEAGQKVEKEVVEDVFFQTNGQPGLVNWFGELLTEKYNPGTGKAIDCKTWKTVLHKAIYVEPNNTVLNLLAKAREGRYRDAMMSVFSRPDVPFAFHDPVGNYLYLNGIIEPYTMESPDKDPQECHRGFVGKGMSMVTRPSWSGMSRLPNGGIYAIWDQSWKLWLPFPLPTNPR